MAAFVLCIWLQEEIRASVRSMTAILYQGHPGSKGLRDPLLNNNAASDNDT